MNDMNNSQGNPGQNPPQDPNQMSGQQHPNQFQNQNPGQFQGQYQNQGQNFDPYTGQPYNQTQMQGSVNPETGNTYWETQNAASNPNQTFTGQQNATMQNTPAQFYQQYQQQMGSSSYPAPQSQIQPQMQPKKKSRKRLVASLITIALVLGIAGTAFAFKDKIMSALSLGKNPAEYYASVEQDTLNASIDKMLQGYQDYSSSDVKAYQVTADFSYDKATLNSMLTGYLGMSIEDLESTIGIPLNSIGADMTIAVEDSKVYDQILLRLNNVDIITVELLIDTIKEELLMRLPELSPAYIRESIEMSDFNVDSYGYGLSTEFEQLKDIKPEEIADFTKRYVKLITDNMKNVELTKGELIEIGDTSEKCNLLTVTIDDETLEDILNAVIKEAKKDKFILKLLPMFGVSEDQYVEGLEMISMELENGLSGSMDGEIVMEVYVNGDGKIIGRNIEVFSDGASEGVLSYGIATKGKNSEYEFYVEDSSKTKLIEVTGGHSKEKEAYTGEAEITLYGEDFAMGSMSFTIDYENLRSEAKGNQVYSYGKISLSSILLMGMEFSIEYDVVDGVQHSKLSVGMGGTSIVGLDVSAKPLKDFTFPKIDGSAVIFDSYDISGYEATMNLEQFISDLSDKLGVDLNTLIENLMYSDFYY